MWIAPLLLLTLAAVRPAALVPSAPAQPAQESCATWQACRDAVEAALAAESYDRALEDAWRAARLGPRDDTGLMFLLARAQARAGRPQDALVMVRRLAERGSATEALTHPDLERTRALEAWAGVEPMVARANEGRPAAPDPPKPAAVAPPKATPAPRAPVTPAGPAAAPMAAPPAPLTAHDLRFAADAFEPAGLAYDAVSHRFVIGDTYGRKLRVAGEGLDHAVDLVRAESAGFLDVRALAIDGRSGDLWVATADAEGRQALVHRIQLISGRPRQSVPVPGESGAAVQPVDMAVTSRGTVMLLDAGGRLLRLRPGANAAERVARLKLPAGAARALALSAGDDWAFVSHDLGLLRVDLRTGAQREVTAEPAIPLKGIERLRAHRDGFVALQRASDDARRLLRFELSRNGRSVRAARTFDVPVPDGRGAPALAVTGDEVFLVAAAAPAGDAAAQQAIGPPADLVVRRVRLP